MTKNKISQSSGAKNFVKQLWKGGTDKNTTHKPAPSQVTTIGVPNQTQQPQKSNNKLVGLWDEAYQLVEKEDAEILTSYENYLLSTNGGQAPALSAQERGNQLRELATRKLKAVQEGELKVIFRGREIAIKEGIARVVRAIVVVKDSIGSAINADPHASIAWAGADNATALIGYVSDLLVRMRVIEDTHGLSKLNKASATESLACLREKMVKLYAEIIRNQIRIACQYSRSVSLRFSRDLAHVDNWQKSLTELKDAKEKIDDDLRVLGNQTLSKIDLKISELQEKADKVIRTLGDISQDLSITKLPCAKFAGFNAFDPSARGPSAKCLENTRIEILKDIETWGMESDDKCIFWLNGMAGTGKSTISRTVAEMFQKRQLLGASFFFSRTGELRNQATSIFPTLATQLTDTLPELRPYLKEAIDKDRTIGEQTPQNQWERLILEPLSELDKSLLLPLPVVVVIDALDECRDHDQHGIMGLFSQAKRLNMIRLRTLIVSRPEKSIAKGFQKLPDHIYQEWRLDSDEQTPQTMRDVSVFLNHKLSTLATENELEAEWPGEDVKLTLAQRTGRLFIYAATVCRFLEGSFPEERLDTLLSTESTDDSPTADLDEIYSMVLRQKITESAEKTTLIALFQKIVGTLILLNETLSPLSLSMLLDIPLRKVRILLDMLRSILVVPDDDTAPVSLFHLSFHDFLLDETRCSNLNIHIEEQKSHENIFNYCLNVMDRHLTRDICQLRRPGTLHKDIERSVIDTHIPHAVQYSCIFWVEHLMTSKSELSNDKRIYQFLTTHLLHWIEVLSLTGKIFDGIGNSTLREFVYDAKRFMFYVRYVAEETPLQLYCSGLLFTAQNSIVKKLFEQEIPPWFEKLPKVEEKWSPVEQQIKTPRSPDLITISSDGKMVTSASHCYDSNKIEVHDTVTGKQILKFTTDKEIMALKFQEGDIKLALVNLSGEIKVLDISTGEEELIFHSPKPEHQPRAVRSAELTHNGLALINYMIYGLSLLNLKTGGVNYLGYGLEQVCHKSLSTDGDFMVTVSADPNGPVVYVFDVKKNQWLEHVSREAFSPGSYEPYFEGRPALPYCVLGKSILAVAYSDGKISLWNDLTSKDPKIDLQGPSSRPLSMPTAVFSSDDTKLVCWYWGSWLTVGILQIWDTRSAQITHTFETTEFHPVSPEFIPNSLRMIGATPGQIEIINLDLEPYWAKHRYTEFLSISQDKKIAAMTWGGHECQNLELWDLEEDTKIIFQPCNIQAIAFSFDGKLLATAYEDGIVTLWDTALARPLKTFRAHGDLCYYLNFSRDNTRLISSNSGPRGHEIRHNTECSFKIWRIQDLLMESSPSHLFINDPEDGPAESRSIAWPVTDNNETLQLGVVRPESEYAVDTVWRLRWIALSHDMKKAGFLYPEMFAIWDIDSGDYRKMAFDYPRLSAKHIMEFFPDGRTFAVGYEEGIMVYSITGQRLQHLKHPWNWTHILTSPVVESARTPAEFALDNSDRWLTRNGERILRLPWGYHARTTVSMKNGVCSFQDNFVFIGTWDYDVLELRFRQDFDHCI
ncbi:hypothetical protein N7540_003729 [Penicillium herquei]|nr:hypothetical protein N7540_003729 [Penicillium herquei]